MNTFGHCTECHHDAVIQRVGAHTYPDSFAGPIELPEVAYSVCLDCGAFRLPLNTWQLFLDAADARLHAWLLTRPFGEFLSVAETVAMLAPTAKEGTLTKAALLKRGSRYLRFIFYLPRAGDGRGTLWFYRPSVERFIKTGDGRWKFLQETPAGTAIAPEPEPQAAAVAEPGTPYSPSSKPPRSSSGLRKRTSSK